MIFPELALFRSALGSDCRRHCAIVVFDGKMAIRNQNLLREFGSYPFQNGGEIRAKTALKIREHHELHRRVHRPCHPGSRKVDLQKADFWSSKKNLNLMPLCKFIEELLALSGSGGEQLLHRRSSRPCLVGEQ